MSQENKKPNVLDKCVGQSQLLEALVEYASDSIVSKTILDSAVGTLTLFAFDAGQSLSEHTSPYNAVVQIINGSGIFTIDSNPVEASVGEILIMPANVPHDVSAQKRFKMLLTMIRA
ncbi:MAG: cupin domain-containing protein [Planctomycetota bacterium]|jgi:quercetin dioxygenase-like cupin family protein